MSSNSIIVREYLSSLKEDKELDYLFPVLLNLMGYRIVQTPKETKGQPQFGKDVVAVANDAKGVKKIFYFELKGAADKDINDEVMVKPDGIISSFRIAKLVKFSDLSVVGLNELPIQYVLVHNGLLNGNTRPVMDAFVREEFPTGNFERWDINTLTDLFSQYLFGEYLLTDEESIWLFKRTLVLLDAPDYDFADFESLVDIQISKVTNFNGGRALTKFFATLNLLAVVVIHYSTENNNLQPAKETITLLLLKLWHWILKNDLDRRKVIRREFEKLLQIHRELMCDYFEKLLPIARQKEGLYSEFGRQFEAIGASLRSFDFVSWMVCYFEEGEYVHWLKENKHEYHALRANNKKTIREVISNNISCKSPVTDNQAIAISLVLIYFISRNDLTDDDLGFLGDYLVALFDNILITHSISHRFPEFNNNLQALIDFVSTGQRPPEYQDTSSLLVTFLFEALAIFSSDHIYELYRPGFYGKINLQIADCSEPDLTFELLLFQRNLNDKYHAQINIDLPESLADFRKNILAQKKMPRQYRTDSAGFPFLRLLAHVYYKNELLPFEWRRFIGVPSSTHHEK